MTVDAGTVDSTASSTDTSTNPAADSSTDAAATSTVDSGTETVANNTSTSESSDFSFKSITMLPGQNEGGLHNITYIG